MRDLIVSNLISADGFISGVDDDISWFSSISDKELESFYLNLIKSIDTMLFGRITYKLMESYWPGASPETDDKEIIDAMNNYNKIVFSHTLDKVEWRNSTLIKDNISDEVRKLKAKSGKDMVIYGSGSIVTQLTEQGLIDKYMIYVYPTAIGKGKTMFNSIKENLRLRLNGTKTFSSGVVLLDYSKV